MAKKKLNVRLLRRIQKHIMAEPKRYDQNVWIKEVDPNVDPYYPPCGTMACIAGWAQILSAQPGSRVIPSHLAASELLGLDVRSSTRLFDSVMDLVDDAWPRKFSKAYSMAKTARGRAKVAVRRIDHFIKTKGAE
jgi:hypothetical protein